MGTRSPFFASTRDLTPRVQVTSWQQGLPLDPVMLTISELLPKVHSIQAKHSRSNIAPVLDFLRAVTLADVLPPAPPITPRRFQVS